MKLVFLSIFALQSFAQDSCPTDKTFVKFQPILEAAKLKLTDENVAAFTHRDRETLTDEKFELFEKEMNVLFVQFDKTASKHKTKMAQYDRTLTRKFENRIEEVKLLNAAQDEWEEATEKNIQSSTQKINDFQKRFQDQLSDRFVSLGKFDSIKNSLSLMQKKITAHEAKSEAVYDQYTDLKKTLFQGKK